MKTVLHGRRPEFIALCLCALFLSRSDDSASTQEVKPERKFLYVAEPGIRNYLEYGGHGVLVFDIDHGHRFVKRIPSSGLDEKGQPLNVTQPG